MAATPSLVFGAEAGGFEASKTGPATASPGETITFTIEATIKDILVGFVITDSLPDNLQYVSGSATVTTNSGDEPRAEVVPQGNGAYVTVEYFDDDAWEAFVYEGDKITLTITAKVADTAAVGSKITNNAVLQYTGGEDVTESATVEIVAAPGAPASEPREVDEIEASDTTVGELDDSPGCGDHFLDFWRLLDIVKGWIAAVV
ncbi:MAG: isopeptide-forming domain-containing fimbrial protein [Clostridia bacterium]|nr:isopeptide-forming domain-containing fimbrial protein [Clostridia bacterium]